MQSFNKLLIVDDSSTSRIIIQRCIDMAGFAVESYLFAGNGLDAIAMVKDNPGINLIVTDINMPKMDGQAFIRLIKGDSSTSAISLVVVSSIACGDAEAELFALGVDAIIKKPVSPEKLFTALSGIGGSHE